MAVRSGHSLMVRLVSLGHADKVAKLKWIRFWMRLRLRVSKRSGEDERPTQVAPVIARCFRPCRYDRSMSVVTLPSEKFSLRSWRVW